MTWDDWIAEAQPTACGLFGLTPGEFADLTLADWTALVAGHIERQHQQEELVGWAVCHLMNVSGNLKPGEPMDLHRLLGVAYSERVAARQRKAKRRA